MKRSTLAALVTALVAVAAPAASGKALPLCLTFTDAAGDAGPNGVGAAGDPSLDVTKVRFTTIDKALVAQITVAKFADRAALATGNRYQVAFNLDGKLVEIYWKNGPLREHEANAFYQQGVRVDGTFKHDGVTGSVKENVVSIAVKLTMLKSAVGGNVEKVKAVEPRALGQASYVGTNSTWDTATGPASGFVVGQACR